MSLVQNDTLPDENLVQVILTAVFFNVLSTIVVALDTLFIFSQIWTKEFRTRVTSYIRWSKLQHPVKVPHHMAIAIGGDDYIELALICDFILYAAQHGVRRLSFYDTRGYLEQQSFELATAWHKLARHKGFTQRVSFATGETYKNGVLIQSVGLQVCLLSKRHAKQALVDVCAEMSQLSAEIDAARVQRQLEMQGVYEVDFLVTLGADSTLLGYPPWALRVAEIHALDRLRAHNRLHASDFTALLDVYSHRDRRLGY